MELPDDIKRDLGTVDVMVPAFRAESGLWTRVVEAGLADEVRSTYAAHASPNRPGIWAVCELLERAGIVVGDVAMDGQWPPLLSEEGFEGTPSAGA